MLREASMITAETDRDAAVVLRTSRLLDQPVDEVVSATFHATAHGVYEARIDAQSVSEDLLSPGWTSYEWRLQVQRHDVTRLLTGRDRLVHLEVTLGNGWYRGDLGFREIGVNYGEEIGFIAQLEIRYADGSVQVIATGEDWTGHRSEIVANSIYLGQSIDARLRGVEGEPLPVRVIEFDPSTLVPQVGPTVVVHESLPPTRIWTSPSGKILIDFGQNLVGWIRLRACGERGSQVTVRHAEVLEHDELGTRPLRIATSTDRYILSGGEDVFEPSFTFHGFRFAEVSGYPGELTPSDLEAVVVHSDIARTGWFECSDPRVNQLVSNSVWSQRGNFLDIPTDCPQRDERLGWTGDIAAYAATSAFQFDVADFLHKWLLDVEAETRHAEGGFVPYVVPDILKYAHFPDFESPFVGGSAIWGDAAAWVPQALWEAYGDRGRLAQHYPLIALHLSSIEPRLSASGLWDADPQLGDWLDPDGSPHDPGQAKADKGVVATASFYRSVSFGAEAARVLGHDEDARRWSLLAERIRKAFVSHYVSDDGVVRSDCATVYALAITFGLLEGELRQLAGGHLDRVVTERDFRVTTGFAGTPYVTWALSETGHIDTAYRLLLEDRCPSWLYPVTMGATTIWERWDSMLPDGSINPGEMTSFNHYALGAVADWIYKVIAGIRPASPGYGKLMLRPTPGPGLDWAKGALDSPHGRIECGWLRTPEGYRVEVLVPEGVEVAEVVLPDGSTREVAPGRHTFDTLRD